jgi:hypothetical protein
VAGASRPLGDPPHRLIKLAIGLPRLLGGSLAEHERAVLAARQFTDLPEPPHRLLHFLRTPRPGHRFGEHSHRQPDRPGGEQRLVDVLADRDRLIAHRRVSSVSVTTRRPPAIAAVHRTEPSASGTRPSTSRTSAIACSSVWGGL